MTHPSYRDELTALRMATSQRIPHVVLPNIQPESPKKAQTMNPLKLFTPLRLATMIALLVVGASSAVALSPSLRNFFFDTGLNADERAVQTQEQLDEQGIAGTATPTATGDVQIQTDGTSASRLMQLMERLTVVTADGATTEVTTGLKEIAKKHNLANAEDVQVIVGTVPAVANQPSMKIEIDFAGEPSGDGVTSDRLRAELKARGLADDLIEQIVQKYEASRAQAVAPTAP